MKIREIQQEIEESLANLPAVILPSELTGLRHFPLGDYNPQVSIRYLKNINNRTQSPGGRIRRLFRPA